jgi:hypothetical protein
MQQRALQDAAGWGLAGWRRHGRTATGRGRGVREATLGVPAVEEFCVAGATLAVGVSRLRRAGEGRWCRPRQRAHDCAEHGAGDVGVWRPARDRRRGSDPTVRPCGGRSTGTQRCEACSV